MVFLAGCSRLERDAEVEPKVASNLSRFRRWVKGLAEAFWLRPRMEITVQTESVLIIRRRQSRRVWCQQCGREVDAVGLQEIGSFTGHAQPRLPGDAEWQDWHLCAGRDGEQVVCLESLRKST